MSLFRFLIKNLKEFYYEKAGNYWNNQNTQSGYDNWHWVFFSQIGNDKRAGKIYGSKSTAIKEKLYHHAVWEPERFYPADFWNIEREK